MGLNEVKTLRWLQKNDFKKIEHFKERAKKILDPHNMKKAMSRLSIVAGVEEFKKERFCVSLRFIVGVNNKEMFAALY